jgi:CRISPR-associated protein Cas1
MEAIDGYVASLPDAPDVPALMGLEGNIRQTYYSAFDEIIRDFEMGNRTKQPPSNEVNALVSYGNMMCYTVCMDSIYHSQLNPTISFLHEPGERRFSLALDIAEIFKPILVDRLVFTVLNKRMLQAADFERDMNRCLLKPAGRKTFSQAWDERMRETIQHRALGRSVSYRHLIQLECYKIAKHCMKVEEYKPFKAWW